MIVILIFSIVTLILVILYLIGRHENNKLLKSLNENVKNKSEEQTVELLTFDEFKELLSKKTILKNGKTIIVEEKKDAN